MDSDTVRLMLIDDWAEIENTPEEDRTPTRLDRWRQRAERLAATEACPLEEVIRLLQEEARAVAAVRRAEIEVELARDLATSRALGEPLRPPWHRRFRRLVAVSSAAETALKARVESAAEDIRVVVART